MPAVSFSLKALILIIQYVFKDLGILCIYSLYKTGIFDKLLLLRILWLDISIKITCDLLRIFFTVTCDKPIKFKKNIEY